MENASSPFGANLKRLRIAKSLSQADLGKNLGVTMLTIGKWESSISPPKCSNIIEVARFFEVSIDYLLGESMFERRITDVSVRDPIPWQVRALPIHGMAKVAVDIFREFLAHNAGSWQGLLEQIDQVIKKPLSRSDVLAICEQAIDCDWVKIGTVPRDSDLEIRLIEKFNLKSASVSIIPPGTLPELQKLAVASAASDVFVRDVRNGDICAFSGGTTLLQMARAIPHSIDLTNVQFFPLDVNPHSDVIQFNAIYIIGILSAKLSARSSSVHFSPDPSGNFDPSKLSPTARNVYTMAQKSTKTFVGVGDPLDQSFTGRPVLDAHLSPKEIEEKGAVSEVLFHLIDKNGELVDCDYNKLVPSIPLGRLRKMAEEELVVGVACGVKKAIPLLAALNGKYLSGVCIDQELAMTLV
jgi:DNA-binding transcriptional regulator LsrR (DeoR family)/DNA-binding XRE family transcriptional regulator